ncbi:hypothetical protein ABFX02_03G099200 [Erythranthe guttata]
MHEYRLADVDRSARKKNNSLRLDDWVLCRIYNKKGAIERQQQQQQHVSSGRVTSAVTSDGDTKPVILTSVPEASPMVYEDFLYLDAADSIPLLHTDSSCSEHVLSPEVESVPRLTEWEKSALEFPFNYMDAMDGAAAAALLMGSQFQGNYQMDTMHDVAAYITKPF